MKHWYNEPMVAQTRFRVADFTYENYPRPEKYLRDLIALSYEEVASTFMSDPFFNCPVNIPEDQLVLTLPSAYAHKNKKRDTDIITNIYRLQIK